MSACVSYGAWAVTCSVERMGVAGPRPPETMRSAMRLPIRLPLRRGPDAIGPTAHYTGHAWGRNGLSHPELATLEGRLLFGALAPAMTASRALGGPTLEGLLLARHRIIDQL